MKTMTTNLTTAIHSLGAAPATFFAALCLLGALATPLARASSPDPPAHGVHACGAHTLGDHSWTSHVDSAPPERGTHWIVYWAGERGSCAFAERTLSGLLKFSDEYLAAARSPNHYAGGTCRWTTRGEDGGETITPFQEIRCTVPITLRGRRYSTTLGALVDPDPRFIGPA